MMTGSACDPVSALPVAPLRGAHVSAAFFAQLRADGTTRLLPVPTAAPRAAACGDGLDDEDDEHLWRAAPARWGSVRWQWYDPETLMGMRRRASAWLAAACQEDTRRMRLDERRHVLTVRAELAQVLDRLDRDAFHAGVESAVVRAFGRRFYRRRNIAGTIAGLRAVLGV